MLKKHSVQISREKKRERTKGEKKKEEGKSVVLILSSFHAVLPFCSFLLICPFNHSTMSDQYNVLLNND